MNEISPAIEQTEDPTEVPACGVGLREHRHEGTLGWETNQHKSIVERAVLGLIKSGTTKDEEAFRRDYWDHIPFRQKVLDAQWAADNDKEYNDGGGPIEGWKSHFYDPDDGKNYRGETSPTAVTQTWKYFKESLWYRYGDSGQEKVGDPEAGFRLGLALHFLTDLSQPMHAANFTNLTGPLLAHQVFESLAEIYKPGEDHFKADPTWLDREVLAKEPSVRGLAIQLAKHSKKVFVDQVQLLLPLYPKEWSLPEVQKVIREIYDETIPQGDLYTAALLLHWGRGCDWPIKAAYRRLLEREVDPGELQTYRLFLRDPDPNTKNTIQAMVLDIARQGEYENHCKKKAANLKVQPREVLFQDVVNVKAKEFNRPTEEDMKSHSWAECVQMLSQSYHLHLGEYRLPGYQGISAIPEEVKA